MADGTRPAVHITRSGAEFHVRWSASEPRVFAALARSFRAMFPRPVDAVWSRHGVWIVPAWHAARLSTWACVAVGIEHVHWQDVAIWKRSERGGRDRACVA